MRSTLATLVILAACAPALAQTAPPTLESVTPMGAARGTKVALTLEGSNIAGATRLIFSEPGFSSAIRSVKEIHVEKMPTPKGVVRTDAPIDDKARRYEVTVDVTIAADVPHGVHAFRIDTPLGVSNLLRFAVSSIPETAEHEPDTLADPQKVTLPAAIVGALDKPGQMDAYQFDARAGEEMVFQVVARPLGSRLDSILRLYDSRRALLAENNDFDLSRDSVLTWRFADAGAYILTIEDVEHGGAKKGYAYRIYAGALPYVTAVFPLGVQRGTVGSVALAGVNLGAATSLKIAAEDPAPLETSLPVAFSTPAGLPLDRKAIALGRYPEVIETEPNDELSTAQRIAIPSTVNGRIFTPSTAGSKARAADADVFRFTARKGQTLVFEVAAQQLGSPLDSIIDVLDANGRPVPRALVRCVAQTEIALNDPDSNRRSMRLATWNEIAINDYLMVGDELLQVQSMPTHPDDDIQLKGFRGGRDTFLDTSARNHSVGEAVYKVEIHPPGATLEPNGMPVYRIDYVNDDGGPRYGGKDSHLTFTAPADGDYFLRLRDVRGLEGERFAYRLSVHEPSPDFALTFDPKSFNIPRGGRVSVTVTAERRDGFDGPIDVELRDLPPGLTSAPGRIAAGADTTVLMLAASDDVSLDTRAATIPAMFSRKPYTVPGVIALRLTGRAIIDDREVVHDANITDPISVVALSTKPDLIVATDAQRVDLTPGKETTLTVKVDRRNGFTARVPISVMNLPFGVRVNDVGLNGVMITEQETSRTIHLVAEPWVKPQTQPLLVVGRVEVNSPLRDESAAMPVELVIK